MSRLRLSWSQAGQTGDLMLEDKIWHAQCGGGCCQSVLHNAMQ